MHNLVRPFTPLHHLFRSNFSLPLAICHSPSLHISHFISFLLDCQIFWHPNLHSLSLTLSISGTLLRYCQIFWHPNLHSLSFSVTIIVHLPQAHEVIVVIQPSPSLNATDKSLVPPMVYVQGHLLMYVSVRWDGRGRIARNAPAPQVNNVPYCIFTAQIQSTQLFTRSIAVDIFVSEPCLILICYQYDLYPDSDWLTLDSNSFPPLQCLSPWPPSGILVQLSYCHQRGPYQWCGRMWCHG